MSIEYEPLFPLLADYWETPFVDLPEKFKARVIGYKIKGNPNYDIKPKDQENYPIWSEIYATRYEGDFFIHWDDLDSDTRRQQVAQIDDRNNPDSFARTMMELSIFIGSEQDGFQGELETMISNAKSNNKSSVVVKLKELSKELALIENADSHRIFSDISLWRKLQLFNKKLPSMKEEAKGKSDYDLVLALDDFAMRIAGILEIDRARVSDDDLALINAEVTQPITPCFIPPSDSACDTPKNDYHADVIPGKLPWTDAGKLTVEAAWEIEKETGARTTASIVMARLQMWANEKPNNHPVLIRVIPHGVVWATKKKREEKNYRIEHCGIHLANWYESRI
jgi:hypothetical protein